MIYPLAMNLITQRPDGMPYDKYREHLKQQKAYIQTNVVLGKKVLPYNIQASVFSPLAKLSIQSRENSNGKRPKPTNIAKKKNRSKK